MDPRPFAAFAGVMWLVAGCATQDQLRQTEADSATQRQTMAALRADVRRAESVTTEQRAAIDRNEASIRKLEAALAETGARAANAQSVSTEFLASLVAVREEQRRQLDENGAAFADLRRGQADLDARLRQGGVAVDDVSRRLAAIEVTLAGVGSKAAELEASARRQRETDETLARQIAQLRTQVEELRVALGSESFLRMMREIEGARQDTAALRGEFEALQKAQADAATRFRNYYVDLDTRIRTMKQKIDEQITRDLQGVGEDAVALRARVEELNRGQADADAMLLRRVDELTKNQAEAAATLRSRVDELAQAQAVADARLRSDREALEARIEALGRRIDALPASEGRD